MNKTISAAGLQFICDMEGFRGEPYGDAGAGVATIGYGTTAYPDGTRVTIDDAKVTKETARGYLQAHIDAHITPYLNKTFATLRQEQFDALCSLIYNIGATAFDGSSLKKAILAGAGKEEITADFCKWNKAGGKVLPGLERRRKSEAAVFFSVLPAKDAAA
jgi:lysozyme